MSMPPRNARGGDPSRGRAYTSAATRIRGRGAAHVRGGRDRGAASDSTNPKAEGLLQGLQSGGLNERHGASRRGSARTSIHGQKSSISGWNGHPNPSSFSTHKPSPSPSQRDYMNHMTTKFQHLKTKREAERAKAIRDGFLADPEKKTSLDNAITPVGTCTEMCPEFERVERIVQNMVDKTEKISNEETVRDVPSEVRMVKRFRRSAAGYDEQLPSDIRTPETLRMTLNYLLDIVIGGEERLATVHKFVWDRTRGIRNDFSIQQVTKEEDVRIAVDCFERIARFHILALHQLSNPENLVGEHFDPHQEREQLNNTLLSLMYYYDDHRGRQTFKNEAEFRSYCIIFELQSQQPDLEDRMQSWPQDLLTDPRIRIAFKLYSAAGNTLYEQGPLRPQAAFDVAQGNAAGFWNLLKSKAVSYLMACVTEIYFGQVRFMALQGLWKSIKRAPASVQAKAQDWTLEELTKLLGFDDEDQTFEFCGEYDLGFKFNNTGVQYLDSMSRAEMTLDKSSTPNKQVFSFRFVEEKRYRRSLVAVINGVGVAQAIREGLVEQYEVEDTEEEEDSGVNDENSMFVPETKKADRTIDPRNPFLLLNPQAPTFTPTASTAQPPLFLTTSPGQTSSVDVTSDATGAPSFLAPVASITPINSSIFGNASSKNSSGNQTTSPQTKSSIFTFAPAPTSSALSSFSFKSFSPNAPATSPPPTAPSSSNNAWPPAVVNGGMNSDDPGDNPELVPALELDVKPLPEPALVPFTDKTNTQLSQPHAEAAPLDKPPSSPRPSFRALPATTDKEPPRPLFSEVSQTKSQSQSPLTAQNNSSTSRPETLTADTQTPNNGDVFPSSESRAGTTTSQSADQRKSNDNVQERISLNNSHSSPLTSKMQPTANQSFSTTPSCISPISTTKSAIPPTFSPSSSPSFTTPANTKPKHKSPLGSQPPIFAAESSAESSPRQQSSVDLSKAAHNLATVAFLEPHGIIQQYIEHTATALIKDALRQFEQEGPLRAAYSARHQLLSKKYFRRWKSIYWRRKLNSNAASRRELLAQSIRKESQRKARGDAELEAILEAQREKSRIQAEQLRRSQEDPNPQVPVSGICSGPPLNTTSGHKRKSLHSDELDSAMNGNGPRKIAKSHGHRRSKTISGTGATSRSSSLGRAAVSSSPFRLSSSALSGRSILLDRNSGSARQLSTSGRKTDSTHTDYFRLKALGIDPDTPLFPDTKSSLERKQRRQKELSDFTPRKRASTLSRMEGHRSSEETTLAATNLQARNVTAPEKSTSTLPSIPSIKSSQVLEEDDDFLRQIREVRTAMAEDTEWFKKQAAEIGKEVEQQEQMRKSASLYSSTNSSDMAPSNLSTGLARVNGYEYAPPVPRTGPQHSLSRTEQRIRNTGARGLATKPVSDYLPVAMSKSTRASLLKDEVLKRPKKGKGKTKQGEKDSKYVYESDENDEDAIEIKKQSATRSRVKQVNHKRRVVASDRFSEPQEEEDHGWNLEGQLRFDVSQYPNTIDPRLEDIYDEEGEEDESVQEDEEDNYSSYNEADGGDEAEEEEEEEEEEGEDEIGYPDLSGQIGHENPSDAASNSSTGLRVGHTSSVDDPDLNRRANPFHMSLRSATPEAAAAAAALYAGPGPGPGPGSASGSGQDYYYAANAAVGVVGGTQMSRATSGTGTGTGVSVDDALVLSD